MVQPFNILPLNPRDKWVLLKTIHDAKGGRHGAPLVCITDRHYLLPDGKVRVIRSKV